MNYVIKVVAYLDGSEYGSDEIEISTANGKISLMTPLNKAEKVGITNIFMEFNDRNNIRYNV